MTGAAPIWAAWAVIALCSLVSFYQSARLMGSNIRFSGQDRRNWRRRWSAVLCACVSDLLCAVSIGWLLRIPWQAAVLVGTAYFLARLSLADALMQFSFHAINRPLDISLEEQERAKRERLARAHQEDHLSPAAVLQMFGTAVVLGGVSTAFLFALISLLSRLAHG